MDYTNQEIVQELLQRGFQTSQRSLERRLQIWGFRRQSGARGANTPVSEALINAVDDLFHHTLLNDTQIAARLRTRSTNNRPSGTVYSPKLWLSAGHIWPGSSCPRRRNVSAS